jgi:hypothetical protein
MRRLEHLPSIKGVEIGVIVREPVRRRCKDARDCFRIAVKLAGRERAELRLKQLCGAGKQAGYWIVEHGDI